MNKTVISNISGMIFHLNEDAYDKLNVYLQTIGSYFNASEGKAEIMADIEARIAEMFKAKITATNQVITDSDVDEVIAIMGQPEEFVDGQSPPVQGQQTRNRIFRDPDNRIFGGVCSGLSAYFGISDPIWLRLLFVLMLFIFGTGPLLYIILWIIIPQAKTSAEKLEMKGEPVNINNISKSVHEEFEGIKKKFNEFSTEAKNINKSENYAKIKYTANRFTDFILNILRLAIVSIGKLFGFLLILFSIVFLVSIIVLFVGSNVFIDAGLDSVSGFSFNEVFVYFFSSPEQMRLVKIALFLVLFVPFFSLLIAGIKILFNIKRKISGMGSVFFIFWLAGIAILIFSAFKLSSDFSNKASLVNEISPTQITSDILYIGMNELNSPNFTFKADSKACIFHIEDEHVLVGYPKLNIIASESDSFKINITNTSFGSNKKEAVERSKRIGYNYIQADSLIVFDGFYKIEQEDKYRLQQVYITVRVPEGKSVELNPLLKKMLYNVENTDNIEDKNMAGKRWKMTPHGLKCENC
ncbi:MAG: PspC domain-containing protein [Bacteroidetes bacterium]|nr:PspC domain-containing protein [Bacteroidota bacterium]HET6244355.1 PspC domain-containing protein [Bacteroidia bacterium]